MAHHLHRSLPLAAVMIALLGACLPVSIAPNPEQVENRVATSVASTLTELPVRVPPTDAPLPTATETLLPSPTFIPLPTLPPTSTPNPKPDYACDIINQRPLDDTTFQPGDSFDIKWTIVNTGVLKWPAGTYLEYQSGPEMTDVTEVELPRLKPGAQHEVILDAVAPDGRDRQIMVWAVYGPGAARDTTVWMCYPYVRIIVDG
jgi:hypothetical protein